MTPTKPLLVFDGECSFCRRWIARWRLILGERAEIAPFQEVADRFPEIPRERFEAAVQFRDGEGRWSEGAEAVFRALALSPRHEAWLWLHERVPGFAAASEAAYRLVAARRPLFDRLTSLLWGPHLIPPGDRLTCWIFLRAMGLVYATAFLSLWAQIVGLVGAQGILPVSRFLGAAREAYGSAALWYFPSLCWLGSGDGVLSALCALGVALSIAIVLGLWTAPAAIGAWALYLSLCTAGQDFLWFQWDGLLLETGLLAVFLAPWRPWSRPGDDPEPSRGARWMLRWLWFRLLVSSAAVKLLSGDPAWHDLSALDFHFETQPLPPWTAWYAHWLPHGAHAFATASMFAIEGLAPFLLLGPRRLRFAAAGANAALQLLIALTGNYGFFNLLTLALCLALLDDGVWPAFLRKWATSKGSREAARCAWPRALLRPALAALFLLGLVPFFGAIGWNRRLLGPLVPLHHLVSGFRSVNSYGLFQVMTTERPEIEIEGSRDGRRWTPYLFRWKPGPLERRPELVSPHMPRLDWQMWFAASRGPAREPWFLSLCERLLRGSPPVGALLGSNPFPGAPPRFVRATLYRYRFATTAERAATGRWWERDRLGPYVPPLRLERGRLVVGAAADTL